MLVRDGVKNSYIAGGILQIILGLVMGFFLLPLCLNGIGVDTGGWYTLVVNDIFGSSFGNYVLAVINLFVTLLFVISFIGLFFRNSLSSFCFKLSALIPLFMLGAVGLDFGILYLGSSLGITDIFTDAVRWILVIASGVFFLLGFVFQFTLSRNKPNKATTYQIAKAMILIAIVVLNFFFQATVLASDILTAIFAYAFIPYFCSWYFLIMGIWQCISSPKLVDPNQSGYYGGYPQAPYGPQQYPQPPYPQQPYNQPTYPQYNQGYPQQPYGQPYMPYPQRPNYGPTQGIANKGTAETKKVEEVKPVAQKMPEPPKVLPPKLPPKLAEKVATQPQTVKPAIPVAPKTTAVKAPAPKAQAPRIAPKTTAKTVKKS